MIRWIVGHHFVRGVKEEAGLGLERRRRVGEAQRLGMPPDIEVGVVGGDDALEQKVIDDQVHKQHP